MCTISRLTHRITLHTLGCLPSYNFWLSGEDAEGLEEGRAKGWKECGSPKDYAEQTLPQQPALDCEMSKSANCIVRGL